MKIRRSTKLAGIPLGVALTLLLTAMSDCSGAVVEEVFRYLSQRDTPGLGIAPVLDYPLPNGCATHIFSEAGLEVDARASVERPARVALCAYHYDDSATTPLVVEVESPDGTVHVADSIDPNSRGEVFLDIRLVDPLGTYVVRARVGDALAEGVTVVATDTTETRVLVTPRRAPLGTTFTIDFANVGADPELHLYRLYGLDSGECDSIETDFGSCWVYLTSIPVSPGASETGSLVLRTFADEPPGTYLVKADVSPPFGFYWGVPELFIVD